ncbi:ScpA family protein [Martelella sp. HB161492]|uniref:segregation and condensation protein A n=1 Tax=Martelella sp. HB161492 TaxID=2720726 RepID=UPI0015912599|nr:ScpA family protein [Martelella sp. HB161492]
MQEQFFPELDDDGNRLSSDDERLVIDVGGFEGPLDLLLHLARTQKVDLARISVLALAEQYLQFIEKARQIRIELAADYLVMAAWLAYLKSRLLIPRRDKDDEPSGEDMAATLAFRLKRLEAMRDAAASLVNRNRLGRDVFARGQPEHIPDDGELRFGATLYDLLNAYSSLRQRQAVSEVKIARRTVWSLTEARELLTEMVGDIADWTALDRFLLRYLAKPEDMRTAIASTFAASLELVREGRLAIRQDEAFAPILMRRGAGRPVAPPDDSGTSGDDE